MLLLFNYSANETIGLPDEPSTLTHTEQLYQKERAGKPALLKPMFLITT